MLTLKTEGIYNFPKRFLVTQHWRGSKVYYYILGGGDAKFPSKITLDYSTEQSNSLNTFG